MATPMPELLLPDKLADEPSLLYAFDALQQFYDATGDSRPYERGLNAVKLGADFMPEAAPPAFATLALSGLAFQEGRTTAPPAKRALKAYSQAVGPNSAEWHYTSSLLPDMVNVSKLATSQETVIGDNERLSSILDPRIRHKWIPPEMWSERIGMASPKFMGKATRSHNIEAFTFNALWNAAVLLFPEQRSERGLYRQIYGGEALIAPVTELMTFDALAAHIRGRGRRQRLIQLAHQRAGSGEPTELAEQALGALTATSELYDKLHLHDRDNVKRMMNGALTMLYGRGTKLEDIIQDTSNHGSYMGQYVAQVGTLLVRGQARKKEEGSADTKRFEDGYDPVDLLGLNVFVKNEADVAKVFAHVIKQVSNASGFEFISSGSRPDLPFKVTGDEDYVNSIMLNRSVNKALGKNLAHVDIKKAPGIFRAAKLTFAMKVRLHGRTENVPFEVQIQTEADREDAQVGNNSHAIRAARERGVEVDLDPAILCEIKGRSNKHLVGKTTWAASAHRGNSFREKISRVSDPGANPAAYRTRK